MNQSMFIQSGVLAIISKVNKFYKQNIKFLKSLRLLIIVIVLAVSGLGSLAIYSGIIKAYENRAITMRTADIQSQCTILSNQLNSYNYLSDPSSEVINTNLTQLMNIYNGRVMIVDKNLQVIKDTYSLDEGKMLVAKNVVKSFQGSSSSYYDKENRYIEVVSPVYDKSGENVSGVMLATVSTDAIEDSIRVLRSKGSLIMGIEFIIMLLIGFFISGFIVKPINKTTQYIGDVTEGYDDKKLNENRFLESEQLSNAFNGMLDQLKQLNDSREEFVSNVSHELRTPLTSMKVLADSLNSMEGAPIEFYQEFMQDIAKEIDRENDIITDLLSLVKMDKSANDLNVKNVNINSLLELILKRLKPIAEKKNIELVLESFRPVNADVDEVKLTLAISNLVENAIKYNKDDGYVHVSLNADHKYFFVKVTDSGIGIPEEDQANIFERFYRVDKSHSREIGGTGLGLAITRNAVILHRGAIKVHSTEGEGTTFTVRIPLIYVV